MTLPLPEPDSAQQPDGPPPAVFTERALPVSRESVHFLRRLLHLAPDIVHVYDLRARRLVYVNQRLTDVLGYAPADLPTHLDGLIALIVKPTPAEVGAFVRQLYTAATNGETLEYECTVRHRDGSPRVLRTRGSVLRRDSTGLPVELLGISADITAKYEAAERLRQREALLHETETLFRYGSWDWAVGSGTVRWSEGLFRLLGYDPADWPDGRVPETLYGNHVTGEEARRYQQRVDQALATGGTYETEHWLQTRQGQRRCVRVRGSVVGGEPPRLVGTVTDVTTEHETTERLQEIEEVRNDVERFFGYGSWVWDLTGEAQTVTWSAGNARLFGYEPNEIPDGRVTLDFVHRHVHPDDLERFQRLTSESIRRRDPSLTLEFRAITKGGEVRHFMRRARLVLDDAGRPLRLVGHNADVTDERQLADQLSRSEELNRRINEVSPDFISIFDVKTGRNRYVGRQLRETLGYSEAEVERHGTNLFFALDPDDWEKLRDFQARIPSLADGEFLTYQVRMKAKDGRRLWLRTRATVFSRDDDGLPAELMAVTQDVTELEENAEALRQSEAFNRQLLRLSPDFITIYNLQARQNLAIGQPLYEYLGYTQAEYEAGGGNYQFIIETDEEREKGRRNIEATLTLPDGTYLTSQIRLRAKDDRPVIIRSRTTVLSRNANGQPVELMTVSQDVTEAETQAEALRQSEAFNRRILELSPDYVNVYDLRTGQTRYLGRNLRERLGYTDKEVAQRGGTVFFAAETPADREKARQNMEGVGNLPDGQFISHQVNLLDRAGQRVSVYLRATVLRRDEHGAPEQALVVIQDVTERELLLGQLRRRDELLDHAQSLLRFGGWEWEPDTHPVWTPGLYRVFGYDPEALPPDHVTSDLYNAGIHPDDQAVIERQFAGLLNGDQTGASFTMRFRTPSGQERQLVGRATKLTADGVTPRIVGATVDVTEEKTAAERLKKQEYLLREAENLLNFGSWEWDIVTGDIVWSEGLFGVFGYGPDDRPPRITLEVYQRHLHPDDLEQAMQRNAEVMREKGTFEGEYRIITARGQERWVHEKGIVVTDAAGNVTRLMGSTADVTELKRYRDELERRVADLARSNTDLEQFAYVASHDLQEPLRKIISFGERLTRRHAEGLGTEGHLYLERITAATARMRELIDNLLNFSRVARQVADFVPTPLNAVLRGVLGDLELKITEKNATVDADELPTLDALPGQMPQLFQNLLGNALKFSRPNVPPHIRIRAEAVSAAEKAEFRLDLRKKWFKIGVEDNGIGFDPQYAEKIFVLFQRLHGRNEYEGTGIGLATVKKIVDNHQGVVYAESTPGQGARFVLLLPLTQPEGR